jgi:hypothetical protein
MLEMKKCLFFTFVTTVAQKYYYNRVRYSTKFLLRLDICCPNGRSSLKHLFLVNLKKNLRNDFHNFKNKLMKNIFLPI